MARLFGFVFHDFTNIQFTLYLLKGFLGVRTYLEENEGSAEDGEVKSVPKNRSADPRLYTIIYL